MSDKTGEKDETAPNLCDELYAAYLIARSGREVQARGGWTLGEGYAEALGVHHFHRGTKPLSQRRLVKKVDVAIRLLAELREARDRAEERQHREPPYPPGPWVRCPGERGVAFLEAVQAGLVVADPPVVPAEEADVELSPLGAAFPSMRGLTPAGRAYVAAGQSPPPPTVTDTSDTATQIERQACAAWLRREGVWDLADKVAAGAHAAVSADPLGPSPPDPG